MIRQQNFKGYQQSYTLAATASTQNTAITNVPKDATGAGGYMDLLVYNGATTTAFVTYTSGTASAVATTTAPDFVAPGAVQVINMGVPATNIAIILSGTGSGGVLFAVGEGS